MKHVFVRPFRPGDIEAATNWFANNPTADPDVFTYLTTTTRVAFNEDKVLVYAPIQRPLFVDAIGVNPAASETEIASGLKAIVQDTVSQAYVGGHGEIYFLSNHDPLTDVATKHLFEEVPYKLYKVKLSKLETKNDPSKSSL